MDEERAHTVRVAMARAWQAQRLADKWRRTAAERRDLLAKLLKDAHTADGGDTSAWPMDVAAVLAVEVEIDD